MNTPTTSTTHTVTAFENDMKELGALVAQMGGLAERQIADSIDALLRRDTAKARAIISSDAALDSQERIIEERAVTIIARRQPMAIDLREIIGAMRTASDLERIADHAKNNAKRVLAIGDKFNFNRMTLGLESLAKLAIHRVKAVLDAYGTQDVDAALEVWRSDAEIDALYNSLFRELLTYMMEDPRNIGACTQLLFCAKNIERIGDHATNIAETIHFVVKGTQIEEQRPKLDTTSGAAHGE